MAKSLKAEGIEIKGKPKGGKVKVVKYDRSFLARIIQNKTAKPFYAALKNYCMSFQQVKSRSAWGAESFAVGKDTIVKMVVRGGALCICLALSPDRYDREQYPHKDCSNVKAYESTPMMVPVLSATDLKRTRRLIADAFTERCIYTVEFPEEKDYLAELPYESDDALVKKKLIKATESMMEEAAAAKALDEAINEEGKEAEEIAAILPKKEKTPRKKKSSGDDVEEVLFELMDDPAEEIPEDAAEEQKEEIDISQAPAEAILIEDTPTPEGAPTVEVAPENAILIEEAPTVEDVPEEETPIEEEKSSEEVIEEAKSIETLPEEGKPIEEVIEEVVFELAEDPVEMPADEVPVVKDAPVVEAAPVIEEAPVIEAAPAVEESPADEEDDIEEVIFDLAEEEAEEEEDIEDVVFELAEPQAPLEDAGGNMESYGEDDMQGKYVTLRKYVRGFTAKMRQGDQERKDYYAEIKARLLSFKGVKVLESFSGDSFKKGQKHLLKSRIRGKTLCLFFALDTDEYKQSVYRQQYKGDTKAYADTPMMVRVKSDQGLKRALRLIEELERIHLLKPSDTPPSFAEIRKTYLYEETPSLVEKGLVKTRLVTVSRYEAELLLKKKAK